MELKKAIIFIDAANYHYALRGENWKIDFKRFAGYFKKFYDVRGFFYYEGQITKALFFDKNIDAALKDFIRAKDNKKEYFRLLKSLGFTVRSKLVTRIYDATEGRYKHKCNFDVELTVDAIDTMAEYEVFILCSGDGDFVKLLKYLKGHHKKTVVVSHSRRISHQLEKAANEIIYLEDLREEIERKRKAQS